MKENGHPGDFGKSLFEQLQPLAGQVRTNVGEPGDISARLRKAGDQALPHWVVIGIAHDNRDCAGHLLGRPGRSYAYGYNAVHIETDKFRGQFGKLIELPFAKTPLNDKILSFNIPKIAEISSESFFTGPYAGWIRQIAYAINFVGLLRYGRKAKREEHCAKRNG
jgi:hypothetical protein